MKRTKLYIKADVVHHEFVYSGIEFYEFIHYLRKPIENIVLLKANYIGNDCQNNFELVEGNTDIDLLSQEDVYSFGDFCFLDYAKHENIGRLTDEQIAEMLYLAHMNKPLKSPFFDVLNNRFAYLAHDDGFFCKLYCRELEDMMNIISGKISEEFHKKNPIPYLDASILTQIIQIAEEGIFIDFDDLVRSKGSMVVDIYCIGKQLDMDKIYNSTQEIKQSATKRYQLLLHDDEWELH